MYWSDWSESSTTRLGGGKIEKAWMNGNGRSIFVSHNMIWPNGLTIDYVNKALYWCDAFLHRIERINLDGTNRVCFDIVFECSFTLLLIKITFIVRPLSLLLMTVIHTV